MTLKNSNYRKSHGRRSARKLGVQSLESRGMLAGDVAFSVGAGNVSLTGDGSDNEITITYIGSDKYEVVGIGGTMVNGSASVQFEVGVQLTKSLTLSMKGGNDVVIFNGAGTGTLPGLLNIGGGEGDNTITIQNLASVAGKIAVVNSTGDDTVTIASVASAASISITTGKGGADVSLINTDVAGDITVNAVSDEGNGNDLTLDDVSTGANLSVAYGSSSSSIIDVDGVAIGKHLTLRTTGGNVTATFGDSAPNTIGGKLTIDFASGDHAITMDDTDIEGDLHIRTILGNKTIHIATTDIGGHVQMNNGGGKETITIADVNVGDVLPKGNLSIHTGSGDSDIDIQNADVNGNLAIITSNGGDATIQVGSVSAVVLNGSLTIGAGNANLVGNDISVDNLTAKDVSIINGAGDNVVTFGAVGLVNITTGSVSIRNGLGDNDVTINDTTIFRDLTIANGPTNTGNSITVGNLDSVTVGRNVTITDGSGDSTVTLNDLAITGSLSFRGMAGMDDLTLGSLFAVTGVTNIDTGADDDTVDILSGADLSTGKVTINLGAGDDNLTIAAAGTAFNLLTPNFAFEGGLGGSDTLDTNVVLTVAQLKKVKGFESIV